VDESGSQKLNVDSAGDTTFCLGMADATIVGIGVEMDSGLERDIVSIDSIDVTLSTASVMTIMLLLRIFCC
jgi:hypothetical protein